MCMVGLYVHNPGCRVLKGGASHFLWMLEVLSLEEEFRELQLQHKKDCGLPPGGYNYQTHLDEAVNLSHFITTRDPTLAHGI